MALRSVYIYYSLFNWSDGKKQLFQKDVMHVQMYINLKQKDNYMKEGCRVSKYFLYHE